MPSPWLRNTQRRSFQSAPGLEAGRCDLDWDEVKRVQGFNPRPALRPGDASA